MVEIKWKAEELPIHTVIQADPEIIYFVPKGYKPLFMKEGEDLWVEVGDYDVYTVPNTDVEKFQNIEILSVPPSWYEEFRVVPGQDVYSVNRAGHTKHRKYPDSVDLNKTMIHVGGPSFIPITEAVRRAFSVEH